MGTILLMIAFCLLGAGYFLPTLIAFTFEHRHKWAILILNFFAFTAIAWVAILFWSAYPNDDFF